MNDILLSVLALVGVFALTAAAAVFVSAEYSLTTLERMQVDTHAEQVADTRAKRVRQAHHTLSFQLSGAQLGITLTGLATGYIAQPAIATLLHPVLAAVSIPTGIANGISAVLAVLLATAISVVFGELVPKNLAIAKPLEVARAVAGAQWWFSLLLRWLINGLNGSANWIVRRLGVEPAEELRSARNPSELGSVVRSSAEKGTLDQGTAALLDRSLRFGDRTAEELMTPRMRVQSLKQDACVEELIELSRRTGFSRFPVHEGDLDDTRGAVHVKQAFSVPADQRDTVKMSSMMRPVPTVPATLDGDSLLDRLRDPGLQLALVVDEWGGSAGIVTLEDLVEEIVGDVRDEHDRGEVSPVRALGRNSWMVSGLLRADEVTEATGFLMPEGDYETLAGMAVARLGRIPSVGDELRVDGWRLTVMRMDRRRLAELRIAKSVTYAAAPTEKTRS